MKFIKRTLEKLLVTDIRDVQLAYGALYRNNAFTTGMSRDLVFK